MLPAFFEFENPVKILAGLKALDNLPFELERLGEDDLRLGVGHRFEGESLRVGLLARACGGHTEDDKDGEQH